MTAVDVATYEGIVIVASCLGAITKILLPKLAGRGTILLVLGVCLALNLGARGAGLISHPAETVSQAIGWVIVATAGATLGSTAAAAGWAWLVRQPEKRTDATGGPRQ